ncbi:helix-hairpin-helix domain-containing protein [Paraburkholderia bonniea]|uniref:ComEA family DNA-binding protein n=1 Tax=Paraburkholderia bonniea TaxID=2152891 RepID=UPI001291F409|nr:helix-hairpin-helix domain-containing protein [Paraburkholderia bonniea]WJF88974.1 helix-hairpin-helix domain-containing protein [Paraburkholderia bonniea]WJF92290.1 helix-hairpin-helix domain-containing protein [Paraburkholderia bonniea]
MLKKLLLLCAALVLSMSAGLATAIEVNSADQAALESIKGIGPVHAKAIIDERNQHGPFKDADDLANRVKGIGSKSVTHLEAAGLTVNGSSAPPSGVKAAPAPAKAARKPAASAAATTAAESAAPAASTPAETAKSKKKTKKSSTAASDAATTATTSAAASDSSAKEPKKAKKAKKSKAASAAAASGV